jgi:hypothetical protein
MAAAAEVRLEVRAGLPGVLVDREVCGGRRSTDAQRAYITAFFDQHLHGRPQHLLDGPSPSYPEVNSVR